MPEKSVFLGQPQNMLYAVDVCVGGGGGSEEEVRGRRCRELWALMQRAKKGLMA